MLELTKKHFIDIHIKIPENSQKEVVELITKFGGEIINQDDELINWKDTEFFKETVGEDTPAMRLKTCRKADGLTQTELANLLGISQSHVSEMEKNKRPIGLKMAKRIGKVLNIGYKVFL